MRVATWNINDVNKRLPLLLAWLDATRPDVVALQELKSTTGRFPREQLAAAGYGSLAVGQPTWNGVALLARSMEPVAVRRALPGDDGDTQARYVEAATDGVLFASLYLPNGNPWPGPKFDDKMVWFTRLLKHAAGLWDTQHEAALPPTLREGPSARWHQAPQWRGTRTTSGIDCGGSSSNSSWPAAASSP